MSNQNIPNLTFPMVQFGRHEAIWTLRPLLYKGGARINAKKVDKFVIEDTLGKPILSRIPLVEKLHDCITGKLTAGGSRSTARANILSLRRFFSWADDNNLSLCIESIENVFINWTEHLLHRTRTVGDISKLCAYKETALIARLFDEALELKVGLLRKTRIRKPPQKRLIANSKADKQNLEQTFEFGHALLDITKALSIEAIRGSLPIRIQFRCGKEIEEWSGIKPIDKVKALNDEYAWPYARKSVLEARAAWVADTSLKTRHSLVNLRIKAEMLIFIAQTGMNLAQANLLKIGKFRYRSHLDGYQVHRVYKDRRQGEVAFEIFSEYKEVFERYIKWRDAIFTDTDNDLLFPLVNKYGKPSEKAADVPTDFQILQNRFKQLEIRFIPPSVLRKTRINWLLRHSLDLSLTADMHSHTKETLLKHYVEPSLQVAMVEIARFHTRMDPSIIPPGPGICIKACPIETLGIPKNATPPDCISPAGCLFCQHHRDIDSEEHMWSLISYRYLKSLELTSMRPSAQKNWHNPAYAVIDRITDKLKFLEQSSDIRAVWIHEAHARVNEADYHPRWDGLIQLMEAKR